MPPPASSAVITPYGQDGTQYWQPLQLSCRMTTVRIGLLAIQRIAEWRFDRFVVGGQGTILRSAGLGTIGRAGPSTIFSSASRKSF